MKPKAPEDRTRDSAFTLVEVILAIGIAVGLLLVALTFYAHAASLRGQLLEETEKLASVRLVMDRLTSDLRAVFPHSKQGFSGTGNSMQFTTENLVEAAAWAPVAGGRRDAPVTDLKVVLYYLATSVEGTNRVVSGLERSEVAFPIRASPSPGLAATRSDTAMTWTNMPPSDPFADMVKFARFRYWDGVAWLADWNSLGPPFGVEVSLGFEATFEQTPLEVYPHEIFRRVIHIPTSRPTQSSSEELL